MTIGHNTELKAHADHKWRSEYPDELTKYFSVAECHEDMFSEDELETLTDFMYNKTDEWMLGNTSGLLMTAGNFDELVNILKEKLSQYIDFDIVTSVQGNFFHTPHQYGIHTDMPERGAWEHQNTPYKSVLIPLYLQPDTSNCRIVFYDQRIADVGTTLDQGSTVPTSHYDSSTDYTAIKDVYDVNRRPTVIGDEKMKQKEMARIGITDKEYHKGLTIERDFKWSPGSLLVFDTAQVHESTAGNFIMKGGVRISFMRTL